MLAASPLAAGVHFPTWRPWRGVRAELRGEGPLHGGIPYRPALPTAKWVASIQELSGGRLLLGAAAGWMEAEFRVLGVPRNRRGKITDETLGFLHRCFADDEVELNGQKFLFLPRPKRPPIFIGGTSEAALARAARYGEGWMPTNMDPDALREPIAKLATLKKEAGKPAPEVVTLGKLPVDDPSKTRDRIEALAEVGVTRIAHVIKYDTVVELEASAEALLQAVGR